MIAFAIPLTNDVNVGHRLVTIIGCAKVTDGMDESGGAGSAMRKCPEEKEENEENDDTGATGDATGQWHRNPSRVQDDSLLLY